MDARKQKRGEEEGLVSNISFQGIPSVTRRLPIGLAF
jgi:hypothetical protein